jgi:hypothetical protein
MRLIGATYILARACYIEPRDNHMKTAIAGVESSAERSLIE